MPLNSTLKDLHTFLFFKEETAVLEELDDEKWRRTQLYMYVTSALVLIWGLFDFIIDYENVWLFIALRVIYTPLTVLAAINFHRPIFRSHHVRWAQVHYIFLILDIGLMVLWSEHFVKYLIGFSTIFWGASVIMLWRFWHTVLPGVVFFIITVIRFTFFDHNVEFNELVTGTYYFLTCLTFTSIISAYVYYSAYELQKSQTSLREAQQKLVQSEKMQSLNLIIAGVAHELNNPLGVTKTACSDANQKLQTLLKNLNEGEVTLDMLEDPAKHALKSLDIALNSADRLTAMVNKFKETAVDQNDNKPRWFDPIEYISEHVLHLGMRRLIKQSHANIALDSTLNQDKIYSYPGVLSQLLNNLLSNAILHGLGDKDVDDRKINIKLDKIDSSLIIIVRDNGKGIAEHRLGKIFDPFYTTVESGIKDDAGSGLGLNIVYNLVTGLLGGTIDVQSKLNEGTVFTITLPTKFESITVCNYESTDLTDKAT